MAKIYIIFSLVNQFSTYLKWYMKVNNTTKSTQECPGENIHCLHKHIKILMLRETDKQRMIKKGSLSQPAYGVDT